MGRPGISYRDVAESCDRMVAQGINPTIDKVLADLGTGSKSTIGTFKKQWEGTRDNKLNNPASLSDNVTLFITQLCDQLQAEARAINEQHDKKHVEELEGRDELLTESAKRNETLQNKLDTIQDNFLNLTSQHNEIKVSLKSEIEARVKAQTENTEKNDKLDTLKAQIVSLEKKYDHAVASLEHFRTSVSEQMKQDQEKWDEAKTGFQHEVSTLKEKLISQNTELSSLNQQNGQLVSEVKSLTQQARTARQTENDLTNKLADTEASKKSLSECFQSEKDKNTELTIELNAMKNELASAQRDASRLETELNEVKQQKANDADGHKVQIDHYQKMLDARDKEISDNQKIIMKHYKNSSSKDKSNPDK